MSGRVLAVVNGSGMPIGSDDDLLDDDTSQAALLGRLDGWVAGSLALDGELGNPPERTAATGRETMFPPVWRGKRRDSRYRGDPLHEWIKVKNPKSLAMNRARDAS